MRQEFYKSTIQSRFIKGLLHSTPLPLYNTITKGDYVVKDFYYIFRKTIVKCTKSGIFGEDAKLQSIRHYDFGVRYPKYTETFQSAYSYYDNITHEWLGRYLRCYRDIYNINLMPFYNCFSGEYISNLVIRTDGIVQTITDDYKVAKVPIKYNTKYTIALDCSADVYLAPAVINKENLVKVTTSKTEVDLTHTLGKNNIKKLNNLTFKSPIIYELENKDESTNNFYQRYERDLYLLIQVPINNYSSIVVLEGDYTKCMYNIDKIIDAEGIDNLSDKEINELFIGQLSLLQLNDEKVHPFADRLVEYLLWNTITSTDTIGNNISRVQEMASNFDINAEFLDGVWTNYLRYLIYNNYMKDKKSKHLDNNGFVDKDVEKFLLRAGV